MVDMAGIHGGFLHCYGWQPILYVIDYAYAF